VTSKKEEKQRKFERIDTFIANNPKIIPKTGDFLDKSTWTLAGILVLLILASNIALKGNFGDADSKLLQGDDIETVVPETLPEEVTPEAAPVTAPTDSL